MKEKNAPLKVQTVDRSSTDLERIRVEAKLCICRSGVSLSAIRYIVDRETKFEVEIDSLWECKQATTWMFGLLGLKSEF